MSLGCAKNSIDSERLEALLAGAGLRMLPAPDGADVLIVNTCCFIDPAKQESIEAILSAISLKEQGKCRKVVAAGCLAQAERAVLASELPEVDVFVGLEDMALLPLKLGLAGAQHTAAHRLDLPRAAARQCWAYLQVADGCGRRCTFCTIPRIRGPLRSRPVGAVLQEATRLVAAGAKELNLIAQDLTQYGGECGRSELVGLVGELARLDGLLRLRLLYLHPAGIADDLLAMIDSEPTVCAYMDIPIQHVSDPLLSAMGRGHDRALLERLFERVANLRRPVTLRTSVVVGFPGETDAHVEELGAFLADVGFRYVSVFEYSEQPGTASAALGPPPPAAARRERRHRLELVGDALLEKAGGSDVGTTAEVLAESCRAGKVRGRTAWQAPEVDGSVTFAGSACPGEVVPVTIRQSDGHDLSGEPA